MCPTPDSTLADPYQISADLQRQLAECRAERDEALARETAMAEVLQVINSSPGDRTPVFDAILEKARILCGADHGSLSLYDGDRFCAVAINTRSQELADRMRQGFLPSDFPYLKPLLDGARLVHLPDLAEIGNPYGARTGLFVPLRKGDALLGMISTIRLEIRPFSDKEIALVENFAAQAVIAIENARLLTETREALEQQTATVEVLQVINSSPGDLTPVFDAMIEKAMSLCEASIGGIYAHQDDSFRAVGLRGVPDAYAEFLHREPLRPDPSSGLGRIRAGEGVVHIADVAAEAAYGPQNPAGRTLLELGGARTLLLVSLTKDGKLLGAIFVYRQEVRPFSDKQIALLQNFAAQAVIAMENARLIDRDARGIGAADRDRRGIAGHQFLTRRPGAGVRRDARKGDTAVRSLVRSSCAALTARCFGQSPFVMHRDAAAEVAHEPVVPDPGSASERIVQGESVVHIPDLVDTEEYRSGVVSRLIAVEKLGARTALWVALRKDDVLVGDFVIYRKEVRPFTDKQIALLQNFAAQAVIAMENARLLTETREALEQQTATAEVLQVINSSPGDLAPVFDAMLEKAMRLCDASLGHLVTSVDGEVFTVAAAQGPPAIVEFLRNRPPTRPGSGTSMERLARGERSVHVHDAMAEEAYRRGDRTRRALVDLGGCRTFVSVGLRKDDALLGAISVYRSEVKPFLTTEIALLENFAAQAVIAMENARLLTETREALEQQTATAEVLQVINSSPGDLAPVFDAMLEKAMRLCEADFGLMLTVDGAASHIVAERDVPEPLTAPGAAILPTLDLIPFLAAQCSEARSFIRPI